MTGQFLFGRSAGAFFLNVFNANIDGSVDSTALILMKGNFTDEYNSFFWGWRVFLEAQIKGNHLFDFNYSGHGLKQDYAASIYALENHEDNYSSMLGNVEPRRELQNLISKIATIRKSFSEKSVFQYVFQNDDPKRKLTDISDLCESVINDSRNFEWARDFLDFKLHEVFKDKSNNRFPLFLQYKINEYASILLSQHWSNIGFAPMEIPKSLIKKIKLDIYPERMWKNVDDKEKPPLIAEALGLFIYRMSLEVALLAKSAVLRAFKDSISTSERLSKVTYTILPENAKDEKANNIAVAINLPIKQRCVVINVNVDKDSSRLVLKKEDYLHIGNVSNETLAHFGLKNAEVKEVPK